MGEQMRVKRSGLIWLIVFACWAYLLTAVFLYVYVQVAWVKAFDLFLALALTLAFSVWYLADRYREPSRPRKLGWLSDLLLWGDTSDEPQRYQSSKSSKERDGQ